MTLRGEGSPAEPAVLGRKRDHSRDADILDAALDVLAEVGPAGFTMDLVAARARAGKATIYRRWTSKAALVVQAVAHMKRGQIDLEQLPDTGSLRGDLLALFKPLPSGEGERRLKIMAGLSWLLMQEQSFAAEGNAALVEPWAAAHLALMQRSVARGEHPATADVHALSQVIPSLAAYRSLVRGEPFSLEFLISMVDGVILPAMRAGVLPTRGDAT